MYVLDCMFGGKEHKVTLDIMYVKLLHPLANMPRKCTGRCHTASATCRAAMRLRYRYL